MALYLGVANNGNFVSSEGYTLQDSDGFSLTALPMLVKRKIVINNVVYRVNIKLPEKESD
jgi:hypothetical protein